MNTHKNEILILGKLLAAEATLKHVALFADPRVSDDLRQALQLVRSAVRVLDKSTD